MRRDDDPGVALLPFAAAMTYDRMLAAEIVAGLDHREAKSRADGLGWPGRFLVARDRFLEFATGGPSVDLPTLAASGSVDPALCTMQTDDAADRLGVSRERVRQLLGAGRLRGFKRDDGAWRIDPTSVDERAAERAA